MSFVSLLRSTVVRRLALLLAVVILCWMGLGDARAQGCSNSFVPQSDSCPDRATARAAAIAAAYDYCKYWYGPVNCKGNDYATYYPRGTKDSSYAVYVGTSVSTIGSKDYIIRSMLADCPAGTEWFESENQCLTPCLDRNPATPPNYGYWTLDNAGTSMCKSGCSFSRGDILERRDFQVCGSGQCTSGGSQVRAIWRFNGAKCSTQPTDPPPPVDPAKNEPTCTPATAGQTYCVRPNGENCYTASSGRMICWKPSEQGTKTDGPTTQTNNVGNEQPNPPPGSQHTSTVKTSTSTTTNTTTTTINTYTTTSGAPAGSTNQGTAVGADGKPVSDGGTGTGDDEGEKSASGGGDCESPPITSGDPIMGMVATQTWATRCAVEAGNAAKVTGDIANCKQPFTVEGTNANAVKLRAMREQICGPDSVANAGDVFDAQSTDAANAGDGDEPTDEEPDDPFADSKVERDGNWLLDKLDATGFLGAGTCPADRAIAVGAGSIQLSLGPICTMLSAISGLVLALAYLIAFRIMAS